MPRGGRHRARAHSGEKRAAGALEGQPAPIADVLGGHWDGHRVEVTGTLRSVAMDQARLRLEIDTGSARIIARVLLGSISDAAPLIDGDVRLTGVPIRSPVTARPGAQSEVFVDDFADVVIQTPPPAITHVPAHTIASLRHLTSAHRVRPDAIRRSWR